MSVEVVDRSDTATLARAYDEVLVPSFTPDELVDLATLTHDVAAGASEVLVARVPDGELAAVGVWDRAPGSPIGLLSYLAARPGGRSRGAGGVLLDAMVERWQQPDGPAAVLAEVHDPARWPATAEERPVDRLRFYARHGARLLALPWVQPRLTPDRDRVEGMLLIVLSARPPVLDHHEAALDGGAVGGWAADQVRQAEGDDALADAPYREILAGAHGWLALVDIPATLGEEIDRRGS